MQIQTVLCPVDFTGQTGRELALAKQVCRRYGARLVVEHNLDPRPPNFLTVTWMWSEEFEGDEEQKAGKAQEKLRDLLDEVSSDIRCEAKLTRGPIDEVLLLLVKEMSADLVVMGSHGWSTPEHQSLTEKMISKSSAPVLTVGNGDGDASIAFGNVDGTQSPRILVSVDDDKKPQSAVQYAADLTASLGGKLILLEVLSPDVARSGSKRLEQAQERLGSLLGDSLGDTIQSRVVEGGEVDAILAAVKADQVDLVVRPVHSGMMPWQKHGRQADFDLLHRSECPVVFVPAKYQVE